MLFELILWDLKRWHRGSLSVYLLSQFWCLQKQILCLKKMRIIGNWTDKNRIQLVLEQMVQRKEDAKVDNTSVTIIHLLIHPNKPIIQTTSVQTIIIHTAVQINHERPIDVSLTTSDKLHKDTLSGICPRNKMERRMSKKFRKFCDTLFMTDWLIYLRSTMSYDPLFFRKMKKKSKQNPWIPKHLVPITYRRYHQLTTLGWRFSVKLPAKFGTI